jgi:hypothetical protein
MEHLRYRLVEGHKCWFAGAKVAKSEFIVPKAVAAPSAPKIVVVPSASRVIAEARPVAPDPVSQMVQQGAEPEPPVSEMLDFTWTALCGEQSWGECSFNRRWRLK